MSIDVLSSARKTIGAYVNFAERYLTWEAEAKEVSKKSGMSFFAIFILILGSSIFVGKDALLYGFIFFMLGIGIHYQKFVWREMLSMRLQLQMEIYNSQFIALGFSGRILEEAFFEMQTSPSFDIESISDKCEASMTKEWKDYKEWEKAHSMMEG